MNRVLFLLIFACAGCPKPVPTICPAPGLPPSAAASLLAGLDARVRAIPGIRILASAEAFGPSDRIQTGRLKGKIAIAARPPNKLRIEVQTPFDQTLLVITSDGATMSAYDLRTKVFLRGPASAETLGAMLPIAIAPESLVSSVLGGIALIAPAKALFGAAPVASAAFAPAAIGTLRLVLRAGALEQRIDFASDDLRVIESIVLRGSRVLAHVTLADPIASKGASIPRLVRFEAPEEKVTLTLRIQDFEIAEDLGPDLFTIEVPAGIVPQPFPSAAR